MSIVSSSIADGVATVTLNDPDRRNSLNAEMVAALVDVFDAIEHDDEVRAVVLTGAPPAFCAGADLGNLAEADGDSLRRIYEGFLRAARCTLPTIAAVNGAAVGAGMNMALACDVRVAGARARFDTRFMQIGLHPGGGHTWMLSRIAGPQVAAAAVLFGTVLDGAEAERVGLAYRCVGDDELAATASEMARRAGDAPRELLRVTKATLAGMGGVTGHDEAVDRELEPQVWSTRQPWFAERMSALRERAGRATVASQGRVRTHEEVLDEPATSFQRGPVATERRAPCTTARRTSPDPGRAEAGRSPGVRRGRARRCPRAWCGVEAASPPRRRGGQGQGGQPQSAAPPLEDEDVEAAQCRASGQGRRALPAASDDQRRAEVSRPHHSHSAIRSAPRSAHSTSVKP
ncbi:MAG: enoyl-CoA hydratase [Ilumatobacteraceae bacterium]